MLSVIVPTQIRKLADRFKSTQEFSFGCLCALFTLHLFGCCSLCEAARHLAWSPSVSALQRAVAGFSANRFMRRLRQSILRRLGDDLIGERFCFAIDDVPVEHFGKKIFRIGSWKCHGGGLMRGQRILVLALIDRQRGVALPLAFEVLTNTKDPEHRKATDVAVDLVKLILDDGFPSLPFVFDSWFDSVRLMDDLEQLNAHFVIESKSNRNVKRCAAPGAKWKTWKDILHGRIKRGVKLDSTENSRELRGTRYLAEGRIFIKGRSTMLKAAAVYNKPTDGKFFAVYVSNALNKSGAELWSLSRARWHIEEAFRILKQDFSFGKLPLEGRTGTEIGVCIPFALIVSFQLDRSDWSKRNSTVGSAVKEVREYSLSQVLDEYEKGSKRIALLRLKCRRKVDRNTKKPVNPTADELKKWKDQAA
jgi:hypothetical protein